MRILQIFVCGGLEVLAGLAIFACGLKLGACTDKLTEFDEEMARTLGSCVDSLECSRDTYADFATNNLLSAAECLKEIGAGLDPIGRKVIGKEMEELFGQIKETFQDVRDAPLARASKDVRHTNKSVQKCCDEILKTLPETEKSVLDAARKISNSGNALENFVSKNVYQHVETMNHAIKTIGKTKKTFDDKKVSGVYSLSVLVIDIIALFFVLHGFCIAILHRTFKIRACEASVVETAGAD